MGDAKGGRSDGMNIDTSAIPRAAATVKEAWTQQG